MANIYKSKFTGSQIDNSVELTMSNTATNGQVLTANGAGGASWEDATEVVANPVLSGSETELTGLEVSGIKYIVPSGGTGGVYIYLYEYKNVKKFYDYTLKNNTNIYALLISNSDITSTGSGVPFSLNGFYTFFIYNKYNSADISPIGTILQIEESENESALLPKIASQNFSGFTPCMVNTTTKLVVDSVPLYSFIVSTFKDVNGTPIEPKIYNLTL